MSNSPVVYAAALMVHYDFDLGGYPIKQLMGTWLQYYQPAWLRLAALEALYQGRYKAISVDQILMFWHRRGHPCTHFNSEFERLIGKFSAEALAAVESVIPPAAAAKQEHSRLPAIASAPTTASAQARSPQAGAAAKEASLPQTSPAPTAPATSPALATAASPERANTQSEAVATPPTQASADLTEDLAKEAANSPANQLPETGESSAPLSPSPSLEATTEGDATVPAASEMPEISPDSATTQPSDSPETLNSISSRNGSQLDESTGLDPASQPPIHQFMPSEVAPEFYTKLKAVAQHKTLSVEEIAALASGKADASHEA